MSAYPSSSAKARNWAVFAVSVFVLLAAFNIIDGLAALLNDKYFRADELLFGDLAMWGVIYLVIGAFQLLTAWLIWRGSFLGPLLGILIAGLNALVTLLSIGAYPLWSIVIMAFDGLVIYALTVYGDAFDQGR